MTRYKASLLHFFCSAIILSLIFCVVRWIWYPGPLFYAASGTDLLVILVMVDVVLGSLITLVIFNPKKASLKFDMSVVVLFQLGFMCYGVWTIFSARPVYMVFIANNFYMVTASEIDPKDQKKAEDREFQALPLFGPQFVGTRIPTDQKVVRDLMAASRHGMGLQNLPEYFLPYKEVEATVKMAGKTVRELGAKATTASKDELDKLAAYEAEKRGGGKNVLFIPLLNKKKILTIAIDGASGAVLDIL